MFLRRTVLLAAVWILVLHLVLQQLGFPLFVLGPLDWSAHVATALILLANLPLSTGHSFATAALAAAIGALAARAWQRGAELPHVRR